MLKLSLSNLAYVRPEIATVKDVLVHYRSKHLAFLALPGNVAGREIMVSPVSGKVALQLHVLINHQLNDQVAIWRLLVLTFAERVIFTSLGGERIWWKR